MNNHHDLAVGAIRGLTRQFNEMNSGKMPVTVRQLGETYVCLGEMQEAYHNGEYSKVTEILVEYVIAQQDAEEEA